MTDVTAAGFETHRSYLTRLAYRMLGSLSDAEDVVQDAWLRWHDSAPEALANPRAWLGRVVTRLCLDLMKSARHRRESYVGAWLPEPLIEEIGGAASSDEGLDVPYVLQLALERLSPLERAAFLLHDVFDLPFPEIAETLGRSEAACRQLVSRARRHAQQAGPRHPLSPDEAQRYAVAFFEAAHSTDPSALKGLLAQDAVLHGDGGGKASSVLNPILGSEKIGRFFAGLARKPQKQGFVPRYEPVLINGMPGYISMETDTAQAVVLDIVHGQVQAIYVIRNPDKLSPVRDRLEAGRD
ncbi:sigma-70 family RNA polymerase sigma factor [Bosea sp. TAF32]|uniref:sigma-70 family RNA polymerase sigma factor n=1 Tax=Bosea sp. TAF32 TaxID=3237482 RepID=UPI003F8E95DF